MSQCKCDLRTKLVGDGCRYCNPQEYIDHLIECLEEQRTWVGLTDEEQQAVYDAWQQKDDGWGSFYALIEAKLKEMNT